MGSQVLLVYNVCVWGELLNTVNRDTKLLFTHVAQNKAARRSGCTAGELNGSASMTIGQRGIAELLAEHMVGHQRKDTWHTLHGPDSVCAQSNFVVKT